MYTVLVVDDEESVRYSFNMLLPEPAYRVLEASTGTEALEILTTSAPDLVILDIQMPGLSGLDVLERIQDANAGTPVLVITAHGDSERVIRAMKHGAFEYIEKPFDVPRMKKLVEEALEAAHLKRPEAPAEAPPIEVPPGDRIIGRSAAMREVCKRIGRVAGSDVSVLLTGESGTGKELVARSIYQNSRRAGRPFLAVNCAAIPETLLESELFGYERGAFTGADKRRLGKFELADGGTLLLDEIGDMSFGIQAKLLRVLQEGSLERLGGEGSLELDVRVIAATNQNLETAIAEKRFREDLYYRLQVVTIHLPPLRERKEDLPELVEHFMAKHRALLHRQVSLAPETLELLAEHEWPGNVRELENTLKRAVLLAKGNIVKPEALAAELPSAPKQPAGGERHADLVPPDLDRYAGHLYESVMSRLEREVIVAALARVGGNQVRAAQLLGISRMMLRDRIKKYGIRTEMIVREV